MKTLNNILLICTITLISSNTFAGGVKFIKSFSPRTPAISSEVNNNFTQLQSAINDNNLRILNIEKGIIAIPSVSFSIENVFSTNCTMKNSINYFYFSSGSNCAALADVQLPNKSKITSLQCLAYDNTNSALDINVALYRIEQTSAIFETIYAVPSSTDSSSYQTLSDTKVSSVNRDLIDNKKYSYVLYTFTGTGNAGVNLRLSSCNIEFNKILKK